MLSSIPGLEDYPAARYVIAALVIFVLLTLLLLGLKRLTRGRAQPSQASSRTRQPRLGIVDMYDLDTKRSLLLLRRDNVEHLILIGGPNDVVIETNISRGPRAASGSETERIEAEPREPISRPVIEATPARTTPAERPRPREDAYPEAVAVPAAPRPGETIPPETRPRPPIPLQPAASRTFRSSVTPAPITERRAAPRPVTAAAPSQPSATGGADAAVLSDMAKQLEEALRRPNPASPAPAPSSTRSDPPTARQPPRPPEAPRPRPAPTPSQASPPAPAASADKGAPDPFSVDEIEAEFARLLGRPAQDDKKA